MNAPARRTLLRDSPNARRELADLLQAVGVAELLRLSRRLWVAADILADAPLLDNRAGGFSALEPAWGERFIGLIELLVHNLALGGTVVVAARDGAWGERFMTRLRDAAEAVGAAGRLSTRLLPAMPLRGIGGDSFHLSGALAWSPAGVTFAEEGATFEAGAEAGERAAALFQTNYGGDDA